MSETEQINACTIAWELGSVTGLILQAIDKLHQIKTKPTIALKLRMTITHLTGVTHDITGVMHDLVSEDDVEL